MYRWKAISVGDEVVICPGCEMGEIDLNGDGTCPECGLVCIYDGPDSEEG